MNLKFLQPKQKFIGGEGSSLHHDLGYEVHQSKNSHSYQSAKIAKEESHDENSSIDLPEGYYTLSQLIPPPIEKGSILVNNIEGKVPLTNYIEGKVSEVKGIQQENFSVYPEVKDLGSNTSALEGEGEVDYFLTL